MSPTHQPHSELDRGGIDHKSIGPIVWRALVKYDDTDGEQRAASFAYYAFFALFPLIVLFITMATSFFGDQDRATALIVAEVQKYIPLDSINVETTVQTVLSSRRSAGMIAFLVLAWSALRFFQALVHGVNRAWGTKDYPWWRMPFQNLLMMIVLGSALFFGIITPTILNWVEFFFWQGSTMLGLNLWFAGTIFQAIRVVVQWIVLWYAFTMFYRLAPRRRTRFKEVWIESLFATFGLQVLQWLFVMYTHNFANFNAVYGTLGGVVALLMWIYLSGSVIILGGCLCAARFEIKMKLSNQSVSNHLKWVNTAADSREEAKHGSLHT